MREMDRRTFLLSTGRWLTLAALAPAVSGCGRLLGWSDSQGRTIEDTEVASVEDGTATTTTAPAATSTSEGATTTTAPAIPDLAVVRGESPDRNVRAAVAQLGGMERFVRRDAKVLVKPNVLFAQAPEYAATTNPDVVATIVRMCLEAGAAQVTVLDYCTGTPRAAFQAAKLTQATEEAGGTIKYLSNRNFERMEIPEGEAITSWPLVTDVFEADTFINVPIGKTHGMAGLTLSMKNLMGIMGGSRGSIHTNYAKKITDVCTLVKPHLVILDAYRILVRNGPSGGNLNDVQMPKTVIAGTSQVAVDAYGCTIMGWQPTDLSSLVEAANRGLGDIDLAHYAIYEGAA
jgi:uncharacterized protein (DUF362 family)